MVVYWSRRVNVPLLIKTPESQPILGHFVFKGENVDLQPFVALRWPLASPR